MLGFPKLKNDFNPKFPPQIILTYGKQPEFSTTDPKVRKERT